jgi:protein-L-isoaspartate(D-aspartate) O-methyltransferase
MVAQQLRLRDVRDERVLAAMERVPRELFVSDELRERAYDDAALPIGGGQTISQPYMVAKICEALSLRGDERVLDVGSGSC